jgi:hypothetical protein
MKFFAPAAADAAETGVVVSIDMILMGES